MTALNQPLDTLRRSEVLVHRERPIRRDSPAGGDGDHCESGHNTAGVIRNRQGIIWLSVSILNVRFWLPSMSRGRLQGA